MSRFSTGRTLSHLREAAAGGHGAFKKAQLGLRALPVEEAL